MQPLKSTQSGFEYEILSTDMLYINTQHTHDLCKWHAAVDVVSYNDNSCVTISLTHKQLYDLFKQYIAGTLPSTYKIIFPQTYEAGKSVHIHIDIEIPLIQPAVRRSIELKPIEISELKIYEMKIERLEKKVNELITCLNYCNMYPKPGYAVVTTFNYI